MRASIVIVNAKNAAASDPEGTSRKGQSEPAHPLTIGRVHFLGKGNEPMQANRGNALTVGVMATLIFIATSCGSGNSVKGDTYADNGGGVKIEFESDAKAYVATGPIPIFASLGFAPDGKRIAWAEIQPGGGGVGDHFPFGFYIDGKLVAKTTAAVNPDLENGWWDFSPDGTLYYLGQDETSIKSFAITPSPTASIDTLMASAR